MLPGIEYFIKRQGQIQENHEIYKNILYATSNKKVKTILEVGSWNGLGSTRAIRSGLKINKQANAVGLECNKSYYYLAKISSFLSPRMKIKLGSLVYPSDLDGSQLSYEEKSWIENDVITLAKLPKHRFGIHLIPFDKVDLFISDGGEFSGWAEFKLVENHLTYFVILDDVKTRKNSKVFTYLSQNPLWKLIKYSDERNGTAFFEKISFTDS